MWIKSLDRSSPHLQKIFTVHFNSTANVTTEPDVTEQGQRTLSDADVSIARLEQEVVSLRSDVAELSNQVHDLVDAWNTARGMVKFVRVVGGIATALAATWALVKFGISTAVGK